MAKKKRGSDPAAPDTDKITSVGVGLKASEWDRIAEIAADLNWTRHQLAAWAMRDFLARFEAGEIPVETETQVRKTLPKR